MRQYLRKAIPLSSQQQTFRHKASLVGFVRRRYQLPITVLLIAVTPAAMLAQRAQVYRGFINLNLGTQAISTAFDDNVVFTEFAEQGDFTAIYRIPTGSVLDIDGGVRLPMNLGVAVGITRFHQTNGADVDARIPHPFYFSRNRSIAGNTSGLDRREIALHLSARWFLPTRDPIEFSVFGGPTFFSLAQELVAGVQFDHTYPYNSATFNSTSTHETSKTVFGYHLGTDIGYFFSPNVGIGALIRFSQASTTLPSSDGEDVSLNVGGIYLTGGLRLRF